MTAHAEITPDRMETIADDLGLQIEHDPATGDMYLRIGGKTYRARPEVAAR